MSNITQNLATTSFTTYTIEPTIAQTVPPQEEPPVAMTTEPATTTMLLIDDLAVNPFQAQYELTVSQWTVGPSYLCFLLSGVFITFIITRYCRDLMHVFISILFYLASQLLLLLSLTVSWVVEIGNPGDQSDKRCQIKAAIQLFSMMLPGYCILIITIVRYVFLVFPFSHSLYLKIRFQILALSFAMLTCGLVAASPSLGLCETRLFTSEYGFVRFCGFMESKYQPSCRVFYGLLIGIGFTLPFVSVVTIYFFIYRLAVAAKRSHRILVTSSTEEKSEKSIKIGEQRSIPWSIIITLVVYFFTAVPWAITTVLTVRITSGIVGESHISIFFDIFYSVLQISIGVSPLVFILTIRTLRRISGNLARKLKFVRDSSVEQCRSS